MGVGERKKKKKKPVLFLSVWCRTCVCQLSLALAWVKMVVPNVCVSRFFPSGDHLCWLGECRQTLSSDACPR